MPSMYFSPRKKNWHQPNRQLSIIHITLLLPNLQMALKLPDLDPSSFMLTWKHSKPESGNGGLKRRGTCRIEFTLLEGGK
ncbi:hypothetical protein JCGZ_14041 [Jatropha curcas]|uniref:Uncharacterized protein n=1 Tax=Jatropha curcas TaxID=180498 RepID=A0A067K7P0_JATCU|nr:hypothetical protein JCGZ_14041 [Jatropha curcas]